MEEFADEDFLFELAAAEAEAEALSSKRRKVSTAAAAATVYSSTNEEKAVEAEGAYMAVLKGSKSVLFQQQHNTTTAAFNSSRPGSDGGRFNKAAGSEDNPFASAESSGDSCFKCGKSGHWARDCDSNISSAADPSVPEKACACGLGSCLVLTANTAKNPGRKFYRCPVREENGGCGFFEWCDKSSETYNMPTPIYNQNYKSNPSVPELSCPCGAGNCLILACKSGNNVGRQFYRCPSQASCNFFKWCDDQTPEVGLLNSVNIPKNSGGSRSPCFKCGNDGHWAKDCPQSSFHPPVDLGGKGAPPNTCFKCGKQGHWAKDCPQSSFHSPADLGGKSNAPPNTCYKCSKAGHWAKDCPQSSFLSPADLVGKSNAPPNTCYKCSKPGHWAKDCSSSGNVRGRFGK